MASGLVRDCMGLGGGGDGDGETERLDLPDVVAQFAVGVEAVLVVAGAEVGVPGGAVAAEAEQWSPQ